MPQNTPMKRQFTTIDGRTVMSNLPQHWGGNDWKITGVDNPLPVGNYVQTKSGVWIPQKGSDDGAADVRLTGRNVEEVAFFDALAITDTAVKISQSIDMSKYKSVTWHFRNSHDVNIQVYLQIDSGTTHVYEPGTGWVNTQSTNNRIVLPANTLRMVLKQSILPELYSNVYARPVRWVAVASSTPTSGSLSVFGWGVPN